MLFGLFSRHVKSAEVVVFYPSYALHDAPSARWRARVHACVYEPEINSLRRAALLAIFRRALRISRADAKSALFQKRARLFLVDHERGKDIHIRLAQSTYFVGRTAANGHILGIVDFPAAQSTQTSAQASQFAADDWLDFTAELKPPDSRQFTGRLQCIPPRGVSVISDLDDTIKISRVADRRVLLANTFLEPFRAVEGMAERYSAWQRQGAVFHYVSGSPWQLYLPLEEFRVSANFPAGSWHLKNFRLSDRSAFDFLRSQTQYKLSVIRQIVLDFPEREFVLIGDSGEQDPEIYAEIAREFPRQVRQVYIRDCGAEQKSKIAQLGNPHSPVSNAAEQSKSGPAVKSQFPNSNAARNPSACIHADMVLADRLGSAFAECPNVSWKLINDARELPLVLARCE